VSAPARDQRVWWRDKEDHLWSGIVLDASTVTATSEDMSETAQDVVVRVTVDRLDGQLRPSGRWTFVMGSQLEGAPN